MKVKTAVSFVIGGVPEENTQEKSEVIIYVELWTRGWDSRHSRKPEDGYRKAECRKG
jgi:hypothetical protein